MSEADYNAVQASYRDLVVEKGNAEGLPLFINDANMDQDLLRSFGTFERLRGIKRTYDPDGLFVEKTGPWSFE